MWLSLFLEGIAVFEELGKSWGLCPQTPGRWQPLRGANAALSLFDNSFQQLNFTFFKPPCVDIVVNKGAAAGSLHILC